MKALIEQLKEATIEMVKAKSYHNSVIEMIKTEIEQYIKPILRDKVKGMRVVKIEIEIHHFRDFDLLSNPIEGTIWVTYRQTTIRNSSTKEVVGLMKDKPYMGKYKRFFKRYSWHIADLSKATEITYTINGK